MLNIQKIVFVSPLFGLPEGLRLNIHVPVMLLAKMYFRSTDFNLVFFSLFFWSLFNEYWTKLN